MKQNLAVLTGKGHYASPKCVYMYENTEERSNKILEMQNNMQSKILTTSSELLYKVSISKRQIALENDNLKILYVIISISTHYNLLRSENGRYLSQTLYLSRLYLNV